MLSPSENAAIEILDTVPAIMRTIRAEMRRQRTAELSVAQFRTLVYLNNHPGASLSAVAEHLGLTSPTVCKMVDGLVVNRLVTRLDSSIDRRKIILSLTMEGEAILQKARSATQDRLVRLLEGLSPEQCTNIVQVLQLLYPLFSTGMKGNESTER